jgi:hypothetical protein
MVAESTGKIHSPVMTLKRNKKDNPEIMLHEMLHYYTFPFLDAVKNERDNGSLIADPTIKAQAYHLFHSLDDIYTRAKAL